MGVIFNSRKRRKRRELGLPTKDRRAIRKRLLKEQGGKCYWCMIAITLETSTLDHIKPLAGGGTDSISNFAASCHPCNRRRGARDLDSFHGGVQ
jgi:5-methylcytosine-specific restriction endonuclease McrA